MKKIILIFFSILMFLLLNTSIINAQSSERAIIKLQTSNEQVNINDEFTISMHTQNLKLVACTITLYFDNTVVELVSKPESANVVNNTIIYTYYDKQGGQNVEGNEKKAEFVFKAKQNGVAMFTLEGEFYDENENKVTPTIEPVEIKIGKQNNISLIDEQILEENGSNNVNSTNLAILRLNKEGITPNFQKDIKEYYIIVDENTNHLDVTAIPENENSTVSVSGNNNLKSGANTISIKVISQNKKQEAEYKIYVTKTEDMKNANANLENLAIEYQTLAPHFVENVMNYQLEVANDVENLNVLAIPQNQNANVKVVGTNNLKQGDNEVTVTVTAPNDITFKKYVINVHKMSKEETANEPNNEQTQEAEKKEATNEIENATIIDNSKEANEIEEQTREKETKNGLFIIYAIVIAIAVIGIIGIVVIKKKDVTS